MIKKAQMRKNKFTRKFQQIFTLGFLLCMLALIIPFSSFAEDELVTPPNEQIDEDIAITQPEETSEPHEKTEGEVFEPESIEPYQTEQKSIFDILFGGEDKKNRFQDGNEGDVQKFEEMPKDGDFRSFAKMRILDKTLGKVYHYNIKIGNHIQFNELVVRVLACWSPNYPTLLPEAKGLIEIYDAALPTKTRLFYGWMFSNSSSAASFEHPKFDVQVAACVNSAPAVKEAAETTDVLEVKESIKKTNKLKN